MASNECPFVYQRLDSKDRSSFRLLSLLPGDFDSPLDCTLTHTQRGSQCQPYEALSYAWGDPTLSSEITLNGKQLPITHNLEQALRCLRGNPGGLPRMLWVDAICIDQGHVSERNHQVTQMGEIYAEAESVVIWLGEASGDSDVALAFMLNVYEDFSANGGITMESLKSGQIVQSNLDRKLKEFLNGKWHNELLAGLQILARPWWRRAWIVQELVVAKDAVFHCGQKSFAWSVMEAFIIAASYGKGTLRRKMPTLFIHNETINAARGICHLRASFSRGRPIPLWKLLKRLYRQQCTDPRDKIYSVLGMTHTKMRERLKPDYSKSVSQVFTEAIAADMIDGGDLNALLLVKHGDKASSEDFPSWVADLREVYRPEWLVFPKSQRPAFISFSPNSRILCTDGFMVDSVAENRLQGTDVGFQRVPIVHQNKYTWDIEQITATLLDKGVIYVKKKDSRPRNDFRDVEKLVYEIISAGMILGYQGWVQHTIMYPDEEANGSKAGIGTIISRKVQLQLSRLRKLSLLWRNRLHNRSGNESLKPRQWEDILATAVSVTAGRSLILSSKRYLGLAPTATQPEDCIFVLNGLLELAILRPQPDGTYKFVGAAYIHGYMNEEWQDDLDRGVFQTQTVRIS